MPKAEVKKIVKKYAEVLRENNFPFVAVYLFGSYAKGKVKKTSDIDVAVISKKLERNFLKNEIKLSKLSLKVNSKIEPHGFTPRDFKYDLDPFVLEVKNTGTKIA